MKKVSITRLTVLDATMVSIPETNETHIFHPDWTPHARMHEVWRLITYTCIVILSLWLIGVKNQSLFAAVLSPFVRGEFLIAFFIKSSYKGSMKYLDGTKKMLPEINIGLLRFGISTMLVAVAFLFYKIKFSRL